MRLCCLALVVLAAVVVLMTSSVDGSPSTMGLCIRNCAQCKKMYGGYFEGQLCADWCLKFKGKFIPDCEDINSIGPFLNKLE